MAAESLATSTRVPPVTTLLTVSLSRKTNSIRFNRAYALSATRATSIRSANIPSAIVVNGNNDAMVTDRLHHRETPWLMLPSEVDEISGEKLECFYSLADGETVRLNRKKSLKVPDTAKCVGSTIGSWLAYVDYMKDGSFYLSNPFENEVVELPSLEHLPSVVGVERDPKSGSILKYKVIYSDYSWYDWDEVPRYPYELVDPEDMSRMVTHLALSEEDPRISDCVAMACQGEMNRLAYCRIGKQFPSRYPSDYPDDSCPFNDGPLWYGLQEDYFPGMCNRQVVYCPKRNLFYTLFANTGILAFDVERNRGRTTKKVFQFRAEELHSQLSSHFKDEEAKKDEGEEATNYLKRVRTRAKRTKYLVTLDNGDLLLVVRHFYGEPHKTLHFDVFRVVYPGRLEWVRSLEDRAIFIGNNQSFSIKASKFSGVRPNSIYFTDVIENLDNYGHDIGIFTLKDRVITPFNITRNKGQEEIPPFLWVAPARAWLIAHSKDGDLYEECCDEGQV